MRKYLAIAKASWQEYLAYRLNFFLEVLGDLVTRLVIIAAWFAIYQDLGQETIGEFSLPEMITYLLGVGIINSFILQASQGNDINDDINRGDLSNYLVKPLNIPIYWLIRDICRRVLVVVLGMGEYAILLLFFSRFLVYPSSVLSLITFIIFITLAVIIHFFLFYIFSVIAFWMDQTWGPRFVIRIIMGIATGALIPLSLFPGFWKDIFYILPFKFFAFIPMQIYLNKITCLEIVQELVIGLLWVTTFACISVILWKKGLKKYSAYGH